SQEFAKERRSFALLSARQVGLRELLMRSEPVLLRFPAQWRIRYSYQLLVPLDALIQISGRGIRPSQSFHRLRVGSFILCQMERFQGSSLLTLGKCNLPFQAMVLAALFRVVEIHCRLDGTQNLFRLVRHSRAGISTSRKSPHPNFF